MRQQLACYVAGHPSGSGSQRPNAPNTPVELHLSDRLGLDVNTPKSRDGCIQGDNNRAADHGWMRYGSCVTVRGVW